MKLLKFLVSKVFFLNLFLAIIVFGIGLFCLDIWLDNLTKHGEKVAVPNVIGKQIADLDSSLTSKGFRYEIMDSIWERKQPKGIILDQKPTPNDSVKSGRKIYLTINARTDKMLKLAIGNITNGTTTPREALEYINSIDVVHDSTLLVPYDFNNIVLGFKDAKGRNLKDGDKIKAGSKIWMVVGHNGADKVDVPNVLGLSLNKAVFQLKKNLLNVSMMEKGNGACEIEDLDSSLARVYMQRPSCNESVSAGKEVSIFYTCDTTEVIKTNCK